MEAEVEAKFLADGPEPLERLTAADRLGRASLGPPRVFDEVDRYLDTDDGRLAAAGWACRLRERDGRFRVSLKGPSVAQRESWLHHRPEVEGPATDAFDPRAWPDSDARGLVEQLSGGLPLNERFRLEQRRAERGVELDGVSLGTLTLDAVAVHAGAREAGRLFAVELELERGGDASSLRALAELGELLTEQPGLEPDERTKLEHALQLIASK